MQVYFDANFPKQQDYLKKEKSKRANAASAFLDEIVVARDKAVPALDGAHHRSIKI